MFQHVPYFLKHDSPARVYRSAPSFREETEAQRVKVIPLKSHSSKWQWQDRVKKAPSGGPRWRHLELPFSFLPASRPGRHDFTVSNAEVWRRNLMSGARLVVNSALNCPWGWLLGVCSHHVTPGPLTTSLLDFKCSQNWTSHNFTTVWGIISIDKAIWNPGMKGH